MSCQILGVRLREKRALADDRRARQLVGRENGRCMYASGRMVLGTCRRFIKGARIGGCRFGEEDGRGVISRLSTGFQE